MNRNPILDPTLQEILQVIKPTRADWDTRITVIDQLRNVLQSVESLRGVVVMAWSPLNALFMLLFSHYLICLGFVRCYCSTVWILCLKPLHKMGRLRHLRRLVQRLVNLVHRKEAETDFTWTVTSSNESFRCEERLLITFFFFFPSNRFWYLSLSDQVYGTDCSLSSTLVFPFWKSWAGTRESPVTFRLIILKGCWRAGSCSGSVRSMGDSATWFC